MAFSVRVRPFVLALVAVVTVCLAPELAGAACDVNYVGPIDGLWQTLANWDGNAVPTSVQGACIPGGKGMIVIGAGVAATVKNITAASGLQVASGGSLTIADAAPGYSNALADVTVALGGTVSSAGSDVAIAGTAIVNGTLSPDVQLTSGSLSGTGSVGGSVNNVGGTVRPGGAGIVGTLTIGLAFNQQPTGTLEIDLASDSSYDQIDGPHFNHYVDGTIVVNVLGAYVPSVDTTWDFIPPDGFGTSIPADVTPPEFSAHPIPTGAAISLDSPFSTSTTTSTIATSSTQTTTTTPTTGSSTTTTTLAGQCAHEPTFDSILCLLDALIADVDHAADLGRLKKGIQNAAVKARKQTVKARDAGTGKVAKTQLKKATHSLTSFEHKLASNNAKKLIPQATRDGLRAQSAQIRGEMQTLRGTL